MIHPLLARVGGELNETIHMAVLDRAEVIYQDKIEAPHSIKLSSVIGGRAAVSITLLSTRAEPRRLAELGEHLRGAAAEFSAAAGTKAA